MQNSVRNLEAVWGNSVPTVAFEVEPKFAGGILKEALRRQDFRSDGKLFVVYLTCDRVLGVLQTVLPNFKMRLQAAVRAREEQLTFSGDAESIDKCWQECGILTWLREGERAGAS